MRKILVSLSVFTIALITLSSAETDWTKPALIQVPAGTFQMGSKDFDRAKPVHKVTLTNDFLMGKYEITNQEYADMLNYALSKGYLDTKKLEKPDKSEAWGLGKPPRKYQDVGDEHSQITFKDGKFSSHPGKENYPVVEVTWPGAAFYCNMLSEKENLTPLYNIDDWSCQVYGKAGYRLPTEAEWEYAAKYNDKRKYPWGNNEFDASLANLNKTVNDPVEVLTTPVGVYSPKGDSSLGICDLAGNVAEWCNDWYYSEYTGASGETDPVGPAPNFFVYLPMFKEFRASRVVRGGSFFHDPEYRKEYGVPFMIDSVLHDEAFNNSFRCYDILWFSRQAEGFRVVKTVASDKTKPAFSAAQK